MYLGKVGTQTKTLIAGVRGFTTGAADAIPVVIDSNGQLGTVSSSRRFKEDIQDMPTSLADRLLKLRPVTFRYTRPYTDGSKPIQSTDSSLKRSPRCFRSWRFAMPMGTLRRSTTRR